MNWMIVGYIQNSKTLGSIWDPQYLQMIAQSEVIIDAKWKVHMSCKHGSKEIYMFGVPDNEKYVKEIDTGDECLQRQNSQPAQLGKTSLSYMLKCSDIEAETTHNQLLHREDCTVQYPTVDMEMAHCQHLHQEDQTAKNFVADKEFITYSQCLHWDNRTAQSVAAAIKKPS